MTSTHAVGLAAPRRPCLLTRLGLPSSAVVSPPTSPTYGLLRPRACLSGCALGALVTVPPLSTSARRVRRGASVRRRLVVPTAPPQPALCRRPRRMAPPSLCRAAHRLLPTRAAPRRLRRRCAHRSGCAWLQPPFGRRLCLSDCCSLPASCLLFEPSSAALLIVLLGRCSPPLVLGPSPIVLGSSPSILMLNLPPRLHASFTRLIAYCAQLFASAAQLIASDAQLIAADAQLIAY